MVTAANNLGQSVSGGSGVNSVQLSVRPKTTSTKKTPILRKLGQDAKLPKGLDGIDHILRKVG